MTSRNKGWFTLCGFKNPKIQKIYQTPKRAKKTEKQNGNEKKVRKKERQKKNLKKKFKKNGNQKKSLKKS